MQRIEVPALVRTRVAGHPAKRMPVAVRIEVQTEPPGEPIMGLIEIDKGPLPFFRSERTEVALKRSQRLEIGALHASYTVHVTSERPVTLLVEARGVIHRWIVLAAAAVWLLTAAMIFFLARG